MCESSQSGVTLEGSKARDERMSLSTKESSQNMKNYVLLLKKKKTCSFNYKNVGFLKLGRTHFYKIKSVHI